MIYAYIRVSTKEQNTGRQIMALEPYHIPKQNIYIDYQSGKDFQRSSYQKLIRKLKEGDLLIVKSIDRLGRSYDDILIQWQKITKDIKADFYSIFLKLAKHFQCIFGNLLSLHINQSAIYIKENDFGCRHCLLLYTTMIFPKCNYC